MHRDDGTYNIEFDDKDLFKEFKVPPSRIRKVRKEMEGRRRSRGLEKRREAVTEKEELRGGWVEEEEREVTDRYIDRQTDRQTDT